MYSTPASPQAFHDLSLRHLLDQRAARADVPPSNCSFSEYDDTPSVYSRAVFSPQTNVHDDVAYREPPLPTAHRSDRDRLNDPALSSLDFDDDPRASYISTAEGDPDHDGSLMDAHHPDDDYAAEEDPMSRMSMLGPKMRFHSPAPWEMDDEDAFQEEDEQEEDENYLSSSRGGKRGVGFGTASPRVSSTMSRPSVESTASQSRPKKSFETTSSGSQSSGTRTALQTLAQASLSTTSLAPSLTAGSHSLLQKFSFTRGRPQTPTGSLMSSPFPHSNDTPSPLSRHHISRHQPPSSSFTTPERTHDITRRYQTDSPTAIFPTYDDDDGEQTHPYANPNLVRHREPSPLPYTPGKASQPSGITTTPQLQSMGVSRSDSSITITESSTGSSAATKYSPDSSLTSSQRKSRTSNLQGKDISSPIAIGSVDQACHDQKSGMPNMTGVAGWQERPAAPAFALISLEEARAKRSRSATVQTYDTVASLTQAFPFPEVDKDANSGSDPPPGQSMRQRARSTSASRAKQALNSVKGAAAPKLDRRDSEPATALANASGSPAPGKSLKHKKSGFMRIFNGRGGDKEDREVPPPVPQLSESFAASFNQPSTLEKAPTITSYRVPVPRLSPSMIDGIPPDDIDSQQLKGSGNGGNSSGLGRLAEPFSASPGTKRTPPLSIDTNRSQSSFTPPHGLARLLKVGQYSAPGSTYGGYGEPRSSPFPPQSAPPQVTEFSELASAPSLKLRPVSTTFSSAFGEHFIAPTSLTPALEEDTATTPCSTSPTTAQSPVTPGLFTRTPSTVSSDKTSTQYSSQDQSSIIRALQEQIASAKMSWQRQIWELEGQVRDLKAEVEEARVRLDQDKDYCEACGRGSRQPLQPYESTKTHGGVVNRPRARTGVSHRFASGS